MTVNAGLCLLHLHTKENTKFTHLSHISVWRMSGLDKASAALDRIKLIMGLEQSK